MVNLNNNVELKIRGLEKKEVEFLKLLAKKNRFSSLNQFLVSICREKIEVGKLNRAEHLYIPYLENINQSSNFILKQTEKQVRQLQEFEKQMDRYADKISRWLEYEGEIEDE